MKTLKALHIASFNGNIGDNANHNGFREKLKETLNQGIEFTNLEMREFYQSWAIKDFNSPEFIDLCNSHDLVIFGGGNFFELKWDYSATGTTINLEEETIDAIHSLVLFHGVGCDVAKGASQAAIDKFEKFLTKISQKDNFLISVRNDGSQRTLEELYGDKFKDDIIIVPDGAFFMETEQYEFPELIDGYKYVGINVVNDMNDIRFDEKNEDGISYEEFIEKFSKTLNNFLNKNSDYQLVFYPHIYSDLLPIYQLINKLEDKHRRLRTTVAPLLTGQGVEKYIFGMYTKCEFIVGMRFHASVSAIAQNIPTIGLSSYRKIDDLYKELNLSDRLVQVNRNGFEVKLEKLILETQQDIEKITSQYENVNKQMNNDSSYFYNQVSNWYKNNQ